MSVDEKEVRVASDRVIGVLNQLRKEGLGADVLHVALVDAGVRMGRFYSRGVLPTHMILHSLAQLVLSMEKSEKRKQVKITAHRTEH